MNCVGRIKGVDMQHTLQRNEEARGSEGANEPKLALREPRVSDVQAVRCHLHTSRSIQISMQKWIWNIEKSCYIGKAYYTV